jgi:hypothetical protein
MKAKEKSKNCVGKNPCVWAIREDKDHFKCYFHKIKGIAMDERHIADMCKHHTPPYKNQPCKYVLDKNEIPKPVGISRKGRIWSFGEKKSKGIGRLAEILPELKKEQK